MKSLPIKLKLALLAGIPVIGAIVLSYLVAIDAQRRLDSAKALGSIEDLAKLAILMSKTIDAVQDERTRSALALGRSEPLEVATKLERARVDQSFAELGAFLQHRDTSRLPKRLAEGLASAREKYANIADARSALTRSESSVDEMTTFPKDVNSDLVTATAALMGLSDDGEMLRNIQALVTVLELEERASREAALLSYVFAKQTYPPGGYKALVNLVTEQQVFDTVFRQSTSEDLVRLFDAQMRGETIDRGRKLRQIALETLDDNFGVDAQEWHTLQGEQQQIFQQLSVRLNERVKEAALTKIEQAQAAVVLARNVSLGIVALSLLLASFIGFGVSRSVASLAGAARDVRLNKDFKVRANKVSRDELGALTDAFNEMLDGIQRRDQELEHHRENLEHLVEERTSELAKRNHAMRLVLDTVDQGLATIKLDGTLDDERSRAFDQMFGGKSGFFFDVFAPDDATLCAMLKLGWEGVLDDFLPVEAAVSQIPNRLLRNGRYYDLSYKPMGEGRFEGALVMVTDVTEQVEQRKQDAVQRELLAVFEAVMNDKLGFVEFFREVEGMVRSVATGGIDDVTALRRMIHTIKGNTATFGINSVAETCHRIESACADELRAPSELEIAELSGVWEKFSERVKALFVDTDGVLEIRDAELERLLSLVRAQKPHDELQAMLESFRHEPTSARFRRLGEQAKRLALQLGKGDIRVEIEANNLRLSSDRWGPFWSSLVHVLRNAVDHGLETPEERRAAGKREFGTLSFSSKREGSNFVFEISDDGRGIDWERVRDKAIRLSLPATTREDLVSALFHDGLSTRDTATQVSGRGIGMGAVLQACRELGGHLDVTSSPGRGTTCRVTVPVVVNGSSLRSTATDAALAFRSPPSGRLGVASDQSG